MKESYFAAAPRFDIPLSDDHFHSFVGKHRDASAALMLEYFGENFPVEAFYAEVSAHIGDRAAPLKPGVLEVLAHLERERTPFALVTSSGRPWVDKHFAAHGLTGRFQAIVTRQDVSQGKPHPEPYLKAALSLGVAPAALLAIEDSPTGVEAAHAAGLMTVMVPDLLPPTEACRARALGVARSLRDVLEAVRGAAG